NPPTANVHQPQYPRGKDSRQPSVDLHTLEHRGREKQRQGIDHPAKQPEGHRWSPPSRAPPQTSRTDTYAVSSLISASVKRPLSRSSRTRAAGSSKPCCRSVSGSVPVQRRAPRQPVQDNTRTSHALASRASSTTN